jgi:hypothetical protein
LAQRRRSATLGGQRSYKTMTKTISRALLIALSMTTLGLAACGGSGDSGVDRGKKVNSLSADERTSLCTWGTAEQGGEGKVTQCGTDSHTTVPTIAACEASLSNLSASCTLTVGQEEDCVKAVAADPCKAFASAACAPALACATGE